MKNSESLLEKRRHGTVDFPCAIYQSRGKDGQFYVSPHWHNNVEIIHLKKGKYVINIDMDAMSIDKEMFVFINPQELHRLTTEKGPYEESAVVFDLEFLKGDDMVYRELLEPIMTRSKEIRRYVCADSVEGRMIKIQYERIIDVFQREDIPSLRRILQVKAALYQILAILESYDLVYDREDECEYRIEYVKSVLNYIKGHYTEKIYIGDMAECIGMNEQYFCRFFKRMLGITPMEYLNEYRITQVKHRLASEDSNIMTIAMDCGFLHMGNFINLFKKAEGCTPSEYRKSHKKSK